MTTRDIPPDRKLHDFELRIVDTARNADPKRGISRKQLYAELGVTRLAVQRTLRQRGLSEADLPNQRKRARCKHCKRELNSYPRKDGRPSFCDWRVSMECYTAYRKWKYKHDKEYRARFKAYCAENRERWEDNSARRRVSAAGDAVLQQAAPEPELDAPERGAGSGG